MGQRQLSCALLATLLLSPGCDRSGSPRPLGEEEHRRASRTYGEVETRPLGESLEAIESWLRDRIRPAADTLNRGRRRRDVEALTRRLGLKVPQEVYTLYSWKDGQRGVAEAELLPGYRFLSLGAAEEEYVRMAQQVADGAVPEAWWSEGYLPILKGGTNLFVVVCRGDDAGTVLEWSSISGRAIGYPSLASLMQEVAESYRAGAFYVSDDGSLSRDEEKAAEIFARYHPALPSRHLLAADREVKRKVKKHLGGGRTVTLSSASGDREILRYNDLGGLTSKLVEVEGETVQSQTTEYDDAGRPLTRSSTGFLAERVTWHYGEGGAVEIRKRTPDGTRVLRARLSSAGEWSVLGSSFER